MLSTIYKWPRPRTQLFVSASQKLCVCIGCVCVCVCVHVFMCVYIYIFFFFLKPSCQGVLYFQHFLVCKWTSNSIKFGRIETRFPYHFDYFIFFFSQRKEKCRNACRSNLTTNNSIPIFVWMYEWKCLSWIIGERKKLLFKFGAV